MWNSARVAVIVPAYREARLIGRMLRRVPAFVDSVVVVDDASDDDTAEAAKAVGDPRVQVIRHAENRGVGAAIVTGYRHAAAAGADVLAVMAGDDQMDPDDLEAVIAPVVRGEADYVKGNRFAHPAARRMPLGRRLAGAVLSLATRLATGLAITDAQCGYTALSARAAARLPLEALWPRYGYPNDLLGLLASGGFRVREVPVRPVYADEASGVRPWHALLVLYVIARRRLAASNPRRATVLAGRR
ncbi:MAG: glycosyltransferase family 2 protein [Pseudomonadota bacterium]|nr:MAG: glycosyl transferase [Pseudomonadota bacterium]